MENIKELLKELPVVLASGSPRRIAMLKKFGIEPTVIKPKCEEKIHMRLNPAQTVMALALRKGLWVRETLKEKPGFPGRDFLIISSDTLVFFEGRVLGKPASPEDAFQMLKSMSGKKHTVYSGVCVQRISTGEKLVFFDSTDVYFKPYTDEDIRRYMASENFMDKAGAYGIQEGFGIYVEKLNGDEDTVIGFPMQKLLSI